MASTWASSWGVSWGTSWDRSPATTQPDNPTGGFLSPYAPVKKRDRVQEYFDALDNEKKRQETEKRISELRAQAEALEAKKAADLNVRTAKQRERLRQQAEELDRLYALIAIETARLRQLKDDEEAMIAIMLSMPFNRLTV